MVPQGPKQPQGTGQEPCRYVVLPYMTAGFGTEACNSGREGGGGVDCNVHPRSPYLVGQLLGLFRSKLGPVAAHEVLEGREGVLRVGRSLQLCGLHRGTAGARRQHGAG